MNLLFKKIKSNNQLTVLKEGQKNNTLTKAKLLANLNFNFLMHFLNSQTCVSYMFDEQVDNARANLSMTNINKFLIPLPPISEQERIVTEADHLIHLCDSLEQQINESTNKKTAILKALLATF